MINEQVLEVIHAALMRYANTGGLDNRPERKLAWERAEALVGALKTGDTIASLWSVDDVYALSLNDDGEPDGSISVEEAREVLKRAENRHDAEVGINWDGLRYHLEEVRRA